MRGLAMNINKSAMTVSDTVRPVNSFASMRHAWHSFKVGSARRAAISKLMALEDHMLKDIGLDRSEIESALENRARERRSGVARHSSGRFSS